LIFLLVQLFFPKGLQKYNLFFDYQQDNANYLQFFSSFIAIGQKKCPLRFTPARAFVR